MIDEKIDVNIEGKIMSGPFAGQYVNINESPFTRDADMMVHTLAKQMGKNYSWDNLKDFAFAISSIRMKQHFMETEWRDHHSNSIKPQKGQS